MADIMSRIIRAAKLDASLYEEVEARQGVRSARPSRSSFFPA
jgi:hypothetical protein